MIGRLSGLGRAASRRRADELLELFELPAPAGRTVRRLRVLRLGGLTAGR